MLLHHLRMALRQLARHKTFTFINIGGLAVSLASCIFIFYFVYDEFSYDRFNEKANRIYRITMLFKTPEDTQNLLWTNSLLAPHIKKVYPQVEEAVRIEDVEAVFNNVHKEKKGIVRADRSILNVFTYPLVEGNSNTALQYEHSIIISQSLSEKYFQGMAMGQLVEIDGEPYEVTGVMKDVPSNSDKWINAIASSKEEPEGGWTYQTYILLREGEDPEFIRSKLSEVNDAIQRRNGGEIQFGLDMQALTDLHFWTGTGMDNPKGNKANTEILAAIAIVLLLVALFNFINLTTVISLGRSKEVGVRKVVGAQRRELIGQFLGESALSIAIAALGALVLIAIMSSLFMNVSGKHVSFNNGNDLLLIGIIIGLLMIAVVLSSAYPASVFASRKIGKANAFFRKSLTTLQFALSTGLLIILTTVLYQTNFMRNSSTGFNKDKIIVLELPGDSISRVHVGSYATEMAKVTSVSKVSVAGFGSTPGTKDAGASPISIIVNGEKREPIIFNFSADANYTSILGLNAVEGKSLHDLDEREVATKAVVNESFARVSGWKNPIGESIHTFAGDFEIVGIIPDFHFKSLHNKIEPLVITGQDKTNFDARHLFLKTTSNDIDELRTTWQRILPDHAFEYHFLNDYFDEQYKAETTLQTIFLYFTILTIIIAGSGLFGLTIHHVETKTKEISIRKVLGAGVMGLIQLLSKEFALLTLIGVAIGSVAGITFADLWLNGFAYRIDGSVMTYAPAVLIVVAISLTILVYKTYQGSSKNPVEGLKHE